MYNRIPSHGLMFHNFHDATHKKVQGSISKDQFIKIINYVGRKNILNSDVFLEKLKEKKLKPKDVCLTFDDGIKNQIEIILPILEDLKIKSSFFVQSGILNGKIDFLEVFRYFRNTFYKHINEFYLDFYKELDTNFNNFFYRNSKKILDTKKKSSFYSFEDIKFRLIRDNYLGYPKYKEVMTQLMEKNRFDYKKIYKKLVFNKKDLKLLADLGHIVGSHSHSHPVNMSKLSYDKQMKEYKKSISILSNIIGAPINTMSHPSGNYNVNTLKILKKLKIEMGFYDKMIAEKKYLKYEKNNNYNFLIIPRLDSTFLINKIK